MQSPSAFSSSLYRSQDTFCDNKNDNDENDNEVSDDNEDWTKSCRNSGYNYEQISNFEEGTWDHCGEESDGKNA